MLIKRVVCEILSIAYALVSHRCIISVSVPVFLSFRVRQILNVHEEIYCTGIFYCLSRLIIINIDILKHTSYKCGLICILKYYYLQTISKLNHQFPNDLNESIIKNTPNPKSKQSNTISTYFMNS